MSRWKYILGIILSLVIAFIVGYLVFCYKLTSGEFLQ